MSELEDIARRLIGEKAILDEAKVLHDQTREAAASVLDPGDRKDLGELGMVYVTKPKGAWKIVDQAAMIEWLSEHAPQHLTTRTVIDVSPLILRVMEDGQLPDEDGVMQQVPGVELVAGRPTLTVKPGEQARSVARALVAKELE
jgi:outer membrane receptor for Fe3+-dicitrate